MCCTPKAEKKIVWVLREGTQFGNETGAKIGGAVATVDEQVGTPKNWRTPGGQTKLGPVTTTLMPEKHVGQR